MSSIKLSFQYGLFKMILVVAIFFLSSSSNQQTQGTIIKFKTKSMCKRAGALRHEVMWKSSTGNLVDLKEIRTREHIKWNPAPKEFGPTKAYTISGFHHGLGTRSAIHGLGTDNHSIIPVEFKYQLSKNGKSKVWMVHQQYEMQIQTGEWIPIPGGEYQIVRWFERKGVDLIAYIIKKGVNNRTMYITKQSVPNWFDKKVKIKHYQRIF